MYRQVMIGGNLLAGSRSIPSDSIYLGMRGHWNKNRHRKSK